MSDFKLPEWSAFAPALAGARRFLVGFSGGVDSTVLLDLAKQWSIQTDLPLLAIHINHQLSSNALRWQQHCEQICAQWGIPLQVETVAVLPSGTGREAAARSARFAAYEKNASAEDVLLLGHHRDDQIETVLLRLMRGSGVLGLRGIDPVSQWKSLKLLRPLLPFSKTQLIARARQQQWSWIEDESNTDISYDRNYFRNVLLPGLDQRWPQSATAIARSAMLCGEAQSLLDERAKEDLTSHLQVDGGLLLHSAAQANLSMARQRNLLRYWLRALSLPLPTEHQLCQILETVVGASQDARPLVSWPGVEVRRYRQALYAMEPLAPPPESTIPLTQLATCQLTSGGEFQVDIQLEGTLVSWKALAGGSLSLRFRQGGELCRLHGRSRRPLKKILQDSNLPPWWRDRLPLLYVNDELAVIPGIGTCEGFHPLANEPACRISWQPPQGSFQHPYSLGECDPACRVVENPDFL